MSGLASDTKSVRIKKRNVLIPSRVAPWSHTIFGQPYSKANRRTFDAKKHISIKSKEAQRYCADFAKQCPMLYPMFEGDVRIDMQIYYASRKPDLDESLILDCLQGRVYRNDRQVKEKHVRWGLDPANPRTLIFITVLP